MPKKSAGLLMYKFDKNNKLLVFLVHPGGPFWKSKDSHAWSIPKGEIEENEDELETAKREFKEELGFESKGDFIDLGEIKQKAGKIVRAFAFQGDWSGFLMKQNLIEIEYPYKSGKKIKVPEIDKAGFFKIKEAKEKINKAQVEFIDRLVEKLNN